MMTNDSNWWSVLDANYWVLLLYGVFF
jgi:hypothetical protein